MTNLLAAIITKCTGSTLATYVSNRIYLDQAPDSATFPYVVYSVVSNTPENVFVEDVYEAIIQFSLYSKTAGATEVVTMHNYLRTLFDDATFSVTSSTLVRCMWQHTTTMLDDDIRHWAIDYVMTVRVT